MTDRIPSTEPEPAEEIAPVTFRSRGESEHDELDMTPMVDVTFLLLIFFMVTAAFSLQKSIEVPPPDQQQSATQARTVEELEDDYVIVEIRSDNSIFFPDGSEAPSEQQVLVKLREGREDPASPAGLLVLADGDCRHETVVLVLDAGNAVGMEPIRLAMVDEMDY